MINIVNEAINRKLASTSFTNIIVGKVISLTPLQIRINDRIVIGQSFIEPMSLGLDDYSPNSALPLSVGEKIQMIRYNNGQRFYILGKAGVAEIDEIDYTQLKNIPLLVTAVEEPLEPAVEPIKEEVVLHKIAKSGCYTDLCMKPTLNTNNSTSLATNASEEIKDSISLHKVAKTGKYSDLIGLPTIPTIPTNLVTIDGAQTITAKKTFSVLPESSVAPTTSNQLVNKSYADALLTNYLTTNTAQTISAVKTFSKLPISSVTPTTNNQLVNKSYVDGLLTNYVTTNTAQTISAIKTFTALPISSVTPTSDNQLTNKSYVDAAVKNSISGDTLPIGTQVPFAGTEIPSNWLLCDGSAVSRTTYADLFSVIGTSYGAGDGSTTFNLPDKRGRTSVGANPNDDDLSTIGTKYGEKEHTLTVAEMPKHRHGIVNFNNWGSSATGSGYQYLNNQTSLMGGNPTEYNGSDEPHNNMQPSEVDNWIIKAFQSAGAIATVSNTKSNSLIDTYSCNYINNLRQTIWTGALMGGQSVTLSGVKRFLKIYVRINYGDYDGTFVYEIDTSCDSLVYGSGVMTPFDETSINSLYMSECSYDKNTNLLTHKRVGFYVFASVTYQDRTNRDGYIVYRVDTYD